MLTGTVKFYNDAKGFGFIIDDESQSDIFVHATGLVDKVAQNDKVTYDVKDGKKGPNAINVKKVM
ncbi:cold-shock protein [Cecembia calidifontis]|jgi:CspA family cold shock protein|uniref:Putative cold-shock DNA-binding protein n=1 Tax=Cecembia calidifontis TaxID=1187080 RepID=A0A4Q7P913_9BACT|nr:cold shock domain-containing protein [Cecembia calidifontis]RZS96605.1 putative cold-shock DNA-binding protein [Cecembia calidifontis]